MKSQAGKCSFSNGIVVISGVFLLLFAGLYTAPFQVMLSWWQGDDYSYCYLVPCIVLYLVWEKKNEYLHVPAQTNWSGLAIVLTGILFYWLGELGGEFYILYLSSWVTLMGLLLLNQGLPRVKTIIFPLCLILTMFPLPNFFNFRITLALKLISSRLGVMMMQAYGMSAYREGNVIDLGFTQLQVVDACSGLRYLYPMIVLSIILAYFYKAQMWKKIVLVLSSIPLSIVTNALRIALTGILSEKFGSRVVDGFFHDFEGWLIFMITLGVLMGEMWLLQKIFRMDEVDDEELDDLGEAPLQNQVVFGSKPAFLRPQFFIPALLLALSLGITQGVEFREKIPLAKSLTIFPMKIGRWEAARQALTEDIIDELDLSDYVMFDYTGEDKKQINFYVAYYESQRKGESIHSPASCLRGSGWSFKQAGAVTLFLPDGREMPVNRAVIEREPLKQIAYYWFPFRGRILTNAYQMKLYNFWDALIRQRTDGALVRLITAVYPDETEESAEKRLQGFVFKVVPVLESFLPQ
ncbi:MAG: VPLPA-CTERM-specific exosortase XrtD [Deltaproteobacteria bacterium]|nr:MAG: VPLPA-CTERM-specific exosortase XrtD [Deltaproteobacteria bacterium]